MNRRWLILIVGLAGHGRGLRLPVRPAVPHPGAARGPRPVAAAGGRAHLLPGRRPARRAGALGIAVDRWGERLALSTGLAVAGLALAAATASTAPVPLGACLVVAGAAARPSTPPAAVSSSAGSRRASAGWRWASARRASRSASALAALTLPPLAAAPARRRADVPAGAAASAARCSWPSSCATRSVPAAEPHGGALAPYRTPVLWRIHAASALLVVPQFAVSAFALVYLVDARGWDGATAGRVLAVAQVGGAAARLAAGTGRTAPAAGYGPMRLLAVAIGAGHAGAGGRAAVRPGGRHGRAARRRGGHRHHQRPGVHRGGGVRRAVMGRPRAGHPEHRPEPPGRRHAAGARPLAARSAYGSAFAAVAVVPAGRRVADPAHLARAPSASVRPR